MSHDDERLTRHLHALAKAAVPDGLRPAPPLSARVHAARSASRRRGVLTLAAALLVATLGLVLLSRVPEAALPTAAQGITPTPVPPELVSLALDAAPQTIALHGAQTLVLLALPEAGELIIEVVEPPADAGPVVVGYRPEVRPLFSFDPALTQRLRLALTASPGDVTLFLDPGAASGDAEVTLRAWVDAPAEPVSAGTQPIPALDVPDGMTVMTLPNELTGVLGPALQAGQVVDVYATVLYTDVGDGEFQVPLGMNTPGPDATPGLSTQRLIEAAPVLLVTNAGISLAVSPQDSVTLTWLIQAQMPFTLIPAQVAAATPGGADGPDATSVLPPGTVTVSLPRARIGLIGGEMLPGTIVDVYVMSLLVDLNGDQAPAGQWVAPANAPAALSAEGTPIPDRAPMLDAQRFVREAVVIAQDAETVTLAVAPDIAAVLPGIIDGQFPLILLPLTEYGAAINTP